MGYQVGNNCYATRQDAENVYFSLVPPKIGDDGKLYQLNFTKFGWKYGEQILKAELPECNPIDSMKDGSYIGWSVVAIMAAVWGIRLIWQKLRQHYDGFLFLSWCVCSGRGGLDDF